MQHMHGKVVASEHLNVNEICEDKKEILLSLWTAEV